MPHWLCALLMVPALVGAERWPASLPQSLPQRPWVEARPLQEVLQEEIAGRRHHALVR